MIFRPKMRFNYLIEIRIEKNLLLLGKILLFLNKNRLMVTNIIADELAKEGQYNIQISLSGINDVVEKITKQISKQVGVFEINYQQSVPTSSRNATRLDIYSSENSIHN